MQAVFLDRDGVINENRCDHVKTWTEFKFLPRACEAIANLTRAGTKVFVISNQAVINRGLVRQETVEEINARMLEEIELWGGHVETVAYCPHRPEENCACRKPKPGLILGLARRYHLDLGQSVLIGDALSDIDAGQAAGCRTILVLTGRGEEQLAVAAGSGKNGFLIVPDLFAATHLLLSPDFAPSLATPSAHPVTGLPAAAYAIA